MVHHNRKVLILLSVVALLLLVGGAALAQDKQEMRLVWWGSQNRHDRTIAVVEMYEAAHPEVDIVYEFANFNDYWTLMNTQAAGGELACVMQHDYAYLSEWARNGLLQPLDPFIESGILDTTNIDDVFLQGGRVDGQLYGLSLGTNTQSMILDLDAFEAAGVELPAADWTWDDFDAIALELHEKLGTWAYGSPTLGDDQIWTAMMVSLGTNPFSADNTDFGYTDDQPIIDHFNRLLRLQEAGAIMTPEEASQYSGGPENSPIVAGSAAMQYQWSNQVVAIFAAAGAERHFKLWTMPRPADAVGAANYLKPSLFFSITADCAMPEVAADLINFFTNSPEANDILAAERGVPVSSVIREHLLPSLDASGAETFSFLEMVAQDASPIFPPNPPGYNDLRNNVWTPLFHDPVLYGQISVEEGVAIFRSEGQAILSGN
ncbi:MAG: extracellular solute-binding protein [Anaerolineae bacterium]|nr:extracellular solute-binding protein [Anaerolineae bacterium]NUQ03041.1 extracellular solute-binding protein [Anaerolineae bacterium]